MNSKLRHIILLLVGVGSTLYSLAQTNIEGVINSARKVYQIVSFNEVRISGTQIFADGDTVLLIQMKGATIVLSSDEEQWGNRQSFRNTGLNEFLIVSGIDGDKVTFTRNMQNHAQYNPDDVLQLVKVPTYNNAIINSTLTADSWDGEKGGILAFIVRDTLRFNASIDVSGKGFRGFAAVNSVYPPGNCELNTAFNFNESYAFAGRKGEGLALYSDPPVVSFGANYAKGRGKVINGGGGGNGKFAGGGGGGNAGGGGFGGIPASDCAGSSVSHRATSSRDVGDFINEPGWDIGRRLVMAGGGGSGTGTTVSSGGKGGNAGGMVIIVARVVIGNGRSIIANGEDGGSAPGGGGGGGAGGTVILSIDNFTDGDALLVQLNGGNGGNSQGVGAINGGPGGGGSHGILLVKQTVRPVQIFTTSNVGIAGSSLNSVPVNSRGAFGGAGGTVIFYGLRLVLNGFLFQTVSKNQLVCQNTTPAMITGSDPIGGIGSYTYQWRISLDGGFNFNNISGATGKNYQPSVASTAGTFYYQRRTRDAAGPEQITDYGLPVKIEVLPALLNFWVAYGGGDICAGQTHLPFGGAAPSGGDGTYTFQWQKQTSGNWADALNFSTQQIFIPESLNNTTFFRRITNSSVCNATSAPVTVTVHPVITNNVIQAGQDVCSGSVPFNLTGENPAGGAGGPYSYRWQYRTGVIWENAEGVNNQINYSFNFGLTADRFYRRVVTSGPCIDNSGEIFLDVIPPISNNIIIRSQSDTALCVNTSGVLTGSTPGGGKAGDMRYLWQYSLNQVDWNSAPLLNNQRNYTTDARPVSTYYRRVALSGLNNACRDTTATYSVFVDVKQNTPVVSATPNELWLSETVTLIAPAVLKGTGIWEQEILASEPRVNIVNPDRLNAEVLLQNETNQDILYRFNWRISYLNCEDVVASADVSVKPLFSPNAFSPNLDGLNDLLTFMGLGGSESNELSIFNRQGNLVFRATNYQIGYSEDDVRLWDGRDLNGNHLNDDTYFYTLLVNNKHYFRGFLILKR